MPDVRDVDLFRGTYHPEIDLETLPGLGTASRLALRYSPTLVDGWLGAGWSPTLGSTIERRAIGGGVPAPRATGSDDPADWELSVDGQLLIAQLDGTYRATRDAFTVYRPQIVAAVLATQIVGWTATRDGETRTWGRRFTGASPDGVVTGGGGRVVRWELTNITDARGNEIDLEYEAPTWHHRDTALRLARVYYNQRRHVIELGYEERPDVRLDARDGVLVARAHRLATIQVASVADGGRHVAHAFALGYDLAAGDVQSLLTTVWRVPVAADGTATGAPIVVRRLEYADHAPSASPMFAGWSAVPIDDEIYASGWNFDATATATRYQSHGEFVDVDRDGRADYVAFNTACDPITLVADEEDPFALLSLPTPDGGCFFDPRVFRNVAGADGAPSLVYDDTRSYQLTLAVGSLPSEPPAVRLIDLDDDGYPEVVLGNQTIAGSADGWVAAPAEIGWPGFELFDGNRLADLNADGRPDLVTDERFYPNRGHGSYFVFWDTHELSGFDDHAPAPAEALAADCMTSESGALPMKGAVPVLEGHADRYRAGVAETIDPATFVDRHTSYGDHNGDGVADRLVALAWPRQVTMSHTVSGSDDAWADAEGACGGLNRLYLGDGRGNFTLASTGVGGSFAWPDGPRAVSSFTTRTEESTAYTWITTAPLNHLGMADVDGSGRPELIQACGAAQLPTALPEPGIDATLAGVGFGLDASGACPTRAHALDHAQGQMYQGVGADQVSAGFVDLDGDGLSDQVSTHNAANPSTLHEFGGALPAWDRNTRGVAQNRLTAVIGAHGGRTELTWSSSGVRHHDLGAPLAVIAKISGERGTTTFAFSEGATVERGRVGFATAVARGTSGATMRWRYHVDPALAGTERSVATVLPSGALHQVEVSMAEFAADGRPYDSSPPYWNPVIRTCRYHFTATSSVGDDTTAWLACGAFSGEPATVPATMRLEVTERTWDATYGVMTGKRDYRDVTDRTDGLTAELTYHAYDASLAATRLASTLARDDAGTIREYFTYPAFGYVGMDWTTAYQSDGPGSRTRKRGFAGGALAWENQWGEARRVDYTYDACGEIATRADALTWDQYQRDARCRLIEHTTSAGLTETHGFDDAGRAIVDTIEAGDGSIQVVRHGYDHESSAGEPAVVDVYDAGDGTETVEKLYVDGYGREWRTVVCRRDPARGDTWSGDLEEAYGCAADRDDDRAVSRVTLRSAASGWIVLATPTFDARDGNATVVAAAAADGRVPAVAWSGDVPRTVTQFDVLGREARETPPDGVAVTHAYDLGAGRTTRAGVTTEVTHRGRITRTLRNGVLVREDVADAFGTLTATTDAVGAVTEHGYDGYGRRVSTTGPTTDVYSVCGAPPITARATTRRELTDSDDVAALVDAAGERTEYSYDALGREVSRTGPDGATWGTAYVDAAGSRNVAATDDLGAVTTVWRDALDRETAVDYPDGTSTETAYGARGRVSRVITATGEQLDTRYDRLDRAVTETRTMDTVVATTRYARDARGNVLRVEDADGEVRSTTYDRADRALVKTLGDPVLAPTRELERNTYDASGRLVEQIADGVTYRFTYDGLGRLVGREDGYLTGATPAALTATAWTYTARDQVEREVDALGRGIARSFDDAGRVIEERDVDGAAALATRRYGYDARGLPTRAVDGAGHATCTRYDAYGRVVGVKRDGLGETVTAYARGATAPVAGAPTALRSTTTTAPTGEVTRRFDDALGRVWVVQAPDGSLVQDDHELGLRTGTRRWGRDGTVHSVKRYDHAPASARLIAETDWIAASDEAACVADPTTCPSGRVITGYTAAGRAAAITDAQGNVTTAHYSTDGQALLERVELGGITELTRSYDPSYVLERGQSIGDATDAIVTTWRRDRNLRIAEVERTRATTGGHELTTFGFDRAGHRIQAHFTRDGRVESELAWTYDAQGRVATKAYRVDGLDYLAPGRPYSLAWSYDADGRVASLEYPSGNVVTFERDADGWMDRIATSAGTVVSYRDRDLAGRFHTMDHAGGTTVRRDFRDGYEAWRTISGAGGTVLAETYVRDSIGRMTTIARTAGGVAENSYYAFDARDMLVHEAHDDDGHTTAVDYTYDAAGLRTRKQVSLDSVLGSDETYGYRAGHRLDTVGATALPTDAWDAMGRQLADQRGSSFTWGLDAQLRSITTSAAAAETMLHDALGQRVARTVDGATEIYLSDDLSGEVLHHLRADGTSQDVVRGPGEGVVAFLSETGAITPFTAGDGDGRQLVGDAASPRAARSHGAFGELLAGDAGDAVTQLGFHQTWSTTGSELRMAGVRPYDPDTGRFLAPDPLLFAAAADVNDAADFYRYAHNDPVALSDSTGYATFLSKPRIADFEALGGGTSAEWYGAAHVDFNATTFWNEPKYQRVQSIAWPERTRIEGCFPPRDLEEKRARRRLLGLDRDAGGDEPTRKELREQRREARRELRELRKLHHAELREQRRDARAERKAARAEQRTARRDPESLEMPASLAVSGLAPELAAALGDFVAAEVAEGPPADGSTPASAPPGPRSPRSTPDTGLGALAPIPAAPPGPQVVYKIQVFVGLTPVILEVNDPNSVACRDEMKKDAREAVNAHLNGRIHVDERMAAGSTYTVTITNGKVTAGGAPIVAVEGPMRTDSTTIDGKTALTAQDAYSDGAALNDLLMRLDTMASTNCAKPIAPPTDPTYRPSQSDPDDPYGSSYDLDY